MTRTERVFKVVESESISYSDFARIIGVKKQLVSNWKNLLQEIPDKYLIRIIEEFENVNARWLITGEGEIYGQKELSEEEKTEIEKQYKERLAMKDEIIKAKDELIEVLRARK